MEKDNGIHLDNGALFSYLKMGNKLPLLVGLQNCTTTLEINLVICQKIGNGSTSWLKYTTSGNILKSCHTIPQNTLSQ